ncbi:FtsX-like permease family protein [Candidatus Harpocratesius sp.]
MRTKLSFYIKESWKYVNDSKLAILTLAIAISMVAGFGYYFDSAQFFIMQETNYNVFDYCAQINNPNAKNLNFSITSSEIEVENAFLSSNLEIEHSYYYQLYTNPRLFLYLSQNKYNGFTWYLVETDFFNSERFSQYFQITSGNIPKKTNEILVNEQYAQEFNLSVGSNQSIPFRLGITNIEIIEIPNINIVGFFRPKKDLFQFGTPEDVIEPDTNIFLQSVNFSEQSQLKPNRILINHLQNHTEFENKTNLLFNIKTYVAFTTDRTKIKVSWLSASANEISARYEQFKRKLPTYVKPYNLLSISLQNQFHFQAIVRLSIQFTNLPLYIFAIYMGSMANKTKVRKRYHEFFSMRMRGFPKKMIRNQFLMEALLNSIFVSVLGTFLGIGVFFLGQHWLNPLFLKDFNQTGFGLDFHFTSQTIIETFLFGTILNILATMSTIKHINKLKTSELSSELKNISGDVDYDESSLYYQKKNSENIKSDQLDIENFMKKKEELIPKWGLIAVFSSLIPILLFILMISGQNIIVSDTLIEISNVLYSRINALIILTIISPMLLVIGIIRYLIVESPPRYARISRFISKIFVGKKNYFVGIEMVRQKQFRQIMFLAGFYVAMLMFSNLTTNTLFRLEQVKSNIECGGDINLEFTISKTIFSNYTELTNFENQIKDLKNEKNETVFSDFTHAFIRNQFTGNGFRQIFYLNLSDYYSLISEDETKLLPSTSLLKDIKDAIEFNENLKNETNKVGIIVSSTFLNVNNFQLGETITFLHSSINFTSGQYITKQISAKIIKVIDVMPGLYFSKTNEPSDFIVVSDQIFSEYDIDIFPSKIIREIININENLKQPDFTVQDAKSLIESSTTYRLYSTNYKIYNEQWAKIEGASLNQSNIPYLGLFYFNLIIIGIILAIGMAILIINLQDQNRGLYGELIARGFGRKGINLLVISEMSISFLISLIVGTLAGSFTSVAFCRLYGLSGGGKIYNFPIFFDLVEYLLILGGIFACTYLLLGYTLYKYKKQEISEFLLEVEA